MHTFTFLQTGEEEEEISSFQVKGNSAGCVSYPKTMKTHCRLKTPSFHCVLRNSTKAQLCFYTLNLLQQVRAPVSCSGTRSSAQPAEERIAAGCGSAGHPGRAVDVFAASVTVSPTCGSRLRGTAWLRQEVTVWINEPIFYLAPVLCTAWRALTKITK